ncbi:hypothetical protein L4C34_10090 [Vibrio profundum]|uniref:hypothetical protein n=1 Tax=Vibrio profundum TaxID=2910247 RepID=UPI003D0A85B8
MELYSNYLRIRFWGSWNQKTMDECFERTFEKVEAFNGRPWGLLVDMMNWEFSGPEVIDSWDPCLRKLIDKNLKLHCVACNTTLCEFLIKRHKDNADSNHTLTGGIFGTVREAESWFIGQLKNIS